MSGLKDDEKWKEAMVQYKNSMPGMQDWLEFTSAKAQNQLFEMMLGQSSRGFLASSAELGIDYTERRAVLATWCLAYVNSRLEGKHPGTVLWVCSNKNEPEKGSYKPVAPYEKANRLFCGFYKATHKTADLDKMLKTRRHEILGCTIFITGSGKPAYIDDVPMVVLCDGIAPRWALNLAKKPGNLVIGAT